MTICMAISLLKYPYIYGVYIRINIWFWPTLQLALSAVKHATSEDRNAALCLIQ